MLAVRGGWLFANTGSDLYDFVTDHLTIDRSNFNTPIWAGDLGVSIGSRFDIVGTLESSRSKTESEYRDFVDNVGLPIAQSTQRKEWIVSGTLRMALLPRGRRISRFAWVPRTFTPYVGAGGGAMRWTFLQRGSFVDVDTLRVFDDAFSSDGWTPTLHALAGADLRLYRRLYLTTEGRYTWASGTLGSDFVDFAPVDLAGLRIATGLQVVF